MKILNIIDIPWHSALAAYAFDQSAALAGCGHEIYFAAAQDSAAAAFARKNKFPLTIIPSRKNIMILGTVLKLKKLIESEGIDVVNAHTGKGQTLAWITSLASSRPFAIIRTKADAKRPRNSFALGKTAVVIAGSGIIKRMYVEAGINPAKVEVVYQCITVLPESPKAAASPLKVGILGRLDPVKGHACFIEAAALALKKFPAAEFLIAGREENVKYPSLAARAKELGIEGNVRYLGHVPDSAAFTRSCDIGVIASVASEAVSRAALEWLEAGRPLLATSVGSLPEFVADDCLVPPQDPESMAGALIELLRSPEKRLQFGERNRSRALKDFTKARFAEQTSFLFESAAACIGGCEDVPPIP